MDRRVIMARRIGNADRIDLTQTCETILRLAQLGNSIPVREVREMMTLIISLFRELMVEKGHVRRDVTRITTKFRDAGRRSPPWKAASSRVPGRPQDGSDGNRINRWLLEPGHKFYADEITANLVEIKYYLQALSMDNAPNVPCEGFRDAWGWVVDHHVEPGVYRDPIQLVPIDLNKFVENRRYVESGHLIPLDRGGRHVVGNSFLMIKGSNRLQGNLTIDELLTLMNRIVERHRALGHEIQDDLEVEFSAQYGGG